MDVVRCAWMDRVQSRGLKRFSVSGTALAAGVLLHFQEQLLVASAIPLTQSTPLSIGWPGLD